NGTVPTVRINRPPNGRDRSESDRLQCQTRPHDSPATHLELYSGCRRRRPCGHRIPALTLHGSPLVLAITCRGPHSFCVRLHQRADHHLVTAGKEVNQCCRHDNRSRVFTPAPLIDEFANVIAVRLSPVTGLAALVAVSWS